MLEAEIEVWIAPSTFVQDLLPLGAIRWHNALSSQGLEEHIHIALVVDSKRGMVEDREHRRSQSTATFVAPYYSLRTLP